MQYARYKTIDVRHTKAIALFAMLLLCISARAQVINTQPQRADVRAGNKEYEAKNYTDAEANYKKALEKKNNMPEAIFNLGNAYYAQKRYDEALGQYQLAAQTNPDTAIKAKAYHNIGNVHLQQEKWEDAVKAYKTSLKLRPGDPETKYNLAYANAKLKQQKGEGGQNNQQQKEQKDKDNKEQKDQDKKDDKKDDKGKQDPNKDGDKKPDDKQGEDKKGDGNKDKDQQQKPKGQQPKMSKEDAEKLLDALAAQEQKTNQKVQQKQMKAVKVNIEKDW
jgi:tetratricopeptide (TPR) repeat protein